MLRPAILCTSICPCQRFAWLSSFADVRLRPSVLARRASRRAGDAPASRRRVAIGRRPGEDRRHRAPAFGTHPTVTDASARSGLSEMRRDLVISARAFGASFRNPDLARAQLALLAFSICEWASFIALMVFAFGHGGTGAVGVISLVQLIPAAVIAPLGSVLGDRYRRERVYLLAESSMAVSAAVRPVALVTPPGRSITSPLLKMRLRSTPVSRMASSAASA